MWGSRFGWTDISLDTFSLNADGVSDAIAPAIMGGNGLIQNLGEHHHVCPARAREVI